MTVEYGTTAIAPLVTCDATDVPHVKNPRCENPREPRA